MQAFVSAIDQHDLLFHDFIYFFHRMGALLFLDRRPVDGFFYPPFAAVALSPLGLLPVKIASAVWGLPEVAAMVALVMIPSRVLLADRPRLRFLNGLLVAGDLPILHNFKWGQVSVILTAMGAGALLLRESGKLVLPSVLLAFAVSFKGYPLVLLAYPLFRRDWRFLGVTATLIVLFSVVVPVLCLGWQDSWAFLVRVRELADREVNHSVWLNRNSQYISHVAARWMRGGEAVAKGLTWRLIGIGLAVANAALLRSTVRAGLDRAVFWALLLCFGSLPFLLSTSWPHYFAYLPLAQIFIARVLVDGGVATLPIVAAALFWLLSVVGSSTMLFFAIGNWKALVGSGALFLADVALLIAAWIILLPQTWLRRASARAVGNPALVIA
jgi:hypothetical protein